MKKKLWTIFLMNLFLCIIMPSFGQKSNLIVTDFGGLFAENYYGYDGGLNHFKLKILKEKTNIRTRKVKIKGQLLDLSKDTLFFFDIFLARKDTIARKIEILDTLYHIPFDFEFTNDKKGQDDMKGIFEIKIKLNKDEFIYINLIGYSMLEIKLKEK